MPLPLIVLAMALRWAPVSHAFVPADPAPVIVSPENVDLDGAGTLDFTPQPQGYNVDPSPWGEFVTVRLWVNGEGIPIDCSIGQSPLPQAAQNACAQLLKSATFHLFPGMVLPLRRGFVDVSVEFYTNRSVYPPMLKVRFETNPGYTNTTIIYPPVAPGGGQDLTIGDGHFAVQITPADYPQVALRFQFESASLALLGISRDGQVHDCRPVSSSRAPDTAFLDNYSCQILMQRGRFEFWPSAPPYQGLRYWRQRLRWAMPGD